ncbi:hypothetical protein ATN83_2845 [Raoultella ornithinolytica]|nr:hypothetical protein ATN83_2845 [Raoultella ornithinolytica]
MLFIAHEVAVSKTFVAYSHDVVTRVSCYRFDFLVGKPD